MGKEQNGQYPNSPNDETETIHGAAADFLNAQLTQGGVQGKTDSCCQYNQQTHAPVFYNGHRVGDNTKTDKGQNDSDNFLSGQCIMGDNIRKNHSEYRIA